MGPETEERGVVSIHFQIQPATFNPPVSSKEAYGKHMQLVSSLPIRLDCLHALLETQPQDNKLDQDRSIQKKEVLARTKAHYGMYVLCPKAS